MTDRPFDRRPDHRKRDRERQRGQPQAHAHDEPEERAAPEGLERDRGQIAERRQWGEVPERHDHPVEHQRLRGQAVPEAHIECAADVLLPHGLADQQDRRSDRHEAQERKVERGVARGQRDRAQRNRGDCAAGGADPAHVASLSASGDGVHDVLEQS